MLIKRILTMVVLAASLGPVPAVSQSCGNTKLSCLLPTAFHTNAGTFNFFNEAFGTQIAQLPLATPASGFVFTFNRELGVYSASQESFGPLLAERPETIGRGKAYLAFTYQHFQLSQIDGNDLRHLSILFTFPEAPPQVVTETENRVDSKVDQFVAFGTLGLTDRVDISLAVPYDRISLAANSSGTEFSTTSNAQTTFSQFVSGRAHGIGDIVASAKGTVLSMERLSLALGAEFRFPTGDERNFVGSGAYGIKPYVVLARRGRVTPHLNLSYQWNTASILAADQNQKPQNLPGFVGYAAGADIGITPRLTVVADWTGQHFFSAPQISGPRSVPATVAGNPASFSSVQLISGSYAVNDLGVGVKANPVKHLLITANLTIKLDNGGLRARVVPLAGISYSFSDLKLGIFRRCPCDKK